MTEFIYEEPTANLEVKKTTAGVRKLGANGSYLDEPFPVTEEYILLSKDGILKVEKSQYSEDMMGVSEDREYINTDKE